MRTLPGIAWRHANISNPSGFHDVMEGMHLTRSKWIRGVLWMYAPTVSSIGVLGSNRWPMYMDVSLVWGQQNWSYIVRRRYNPTATFRDFSWQNQRCASYSNHVDWHIPVDLGLLRYPHFDVDHGQQERKPWSWRQFHLWEALALWSLCQGWPQKDHWSMSIKYVRRTGIFGSYTHVCSIKRVDTSIISVDSVVIRYRKALTDGDARSFDMLERLCFIQDPFPPTWGSIWHATEYDFRNLQARVAKADWIKPSFVWGMKAISERALP